MLKTFFNCAFPIAWKCFKVHLVWFQTFKVILKNPTKTFLTIQLWLDSGVHCCLKSTSKAATNLRGKKPRTYIPKNMYI